ncbi:ADP-ribosylglycohydrolase [Salinivibrio sp. PR6]|uniref:GFA family protein n=1 Tax=Salinivibrio sp. PR6 TaxID=1909485 RepID=UPI0009891769|nr:GFA family protein [Salinivibrio sp. PR6]OOE84304.1 ADP-ribosylglycohydrolase [Salinivibrio sp. PR6]
MSTLSASCLCGGVRLTLPDTFLYMGNCHCSECRKFTGADYSSVGGIEAEKVAVTAGQDHLRYYEKSAETVLAFCGQCGSSLFSHKINKGVFNIRLGILDTAPQCAPNFHIHTASKAPWHTPNESLKQFEHGPD